MHLLLDSTRPLTVAADLSKRITSHEGFLVLLNVDDLSKCLGNKSGFDKLLDFWRILEEIYEAHHQVEHLVGQERLVQVHVDQQVKDIDCGGLTESLVHAHLCDEVQLNLGKRSLRTFWRLLRLGSYFVVALHVVLDLLKEDVHERLDKNVNRDIWLLSEESQNVLEDEFSGDLVS